MRSAPETAHAQLAGEIAVQKRIDLAGSAGAGVLGVGLGALFGAALRPIAVPLLVVGGVLHGWSMLARHQRERAADVTLPAWSVALFWLCWGALLALGAYLLLALIRR